MGLFLGVGEGTRAHWTFGSGSAPAGAVDIIRSNQSVTALELCNAAAPVFLH